MATLSTTGTTAWTTVDTAAASNFVGGAKYLLFVVGKMVTDDAVNPSGEWRMSYGATPTVFDRSFHKLETPAVATDASQYNWFTVFTQPATPVDIQFEHRTTDAAQTVTTDSMFMYWMRLDEGLTENTDWVFAADTSGPTTHTTAMASRAAITFTPATASHDWLVLASASVLINSDVVNYEIDMYDSTGVSVLALHSREGEDVNEEQQQTLVSILASLPATSQTVQVRTRDDATGVNSYDKAAVFVMDLDMFKDHFVSTAGSLSQVDTAYLQANTATVTPVIAGDWWFLAGARYVTANAWGVGKERLTLDTVVVPSGFDNTIRYPRCYDATDQQFAMVAASEWLDVSSHTIDHDVRWLNGTGQTWNDRTLVGWSMELATTVNTATDTGVLGESATLDSGSTATDTGTLGETASGTAAVTGTDTAVLGETATASILEEKAGTDTAALGEASVQASRVFVPPTVRVEAAFGHKWNDISPQGHFTFDGTIGEYLSTADVNLLDADTAHLHQSIGRWINQSGLGSFQQSVALTPEFGSFHGEATLTAGTSGFRAITDLGIANMYPVDPSTVYSVTSRVAVSGVSILSSGVRIGLWEYDASSVFLGETIADTVTVSADDTFITIEGQVTTSASAAYVRLYIGGNKASAVGTEKLHWDKMCLRIGSDATFVQSLRVVKNTDHRISLSMPDVTPAANMVLWDTYDLVAFTGSKAHIDIAGDLVATWGNGTAGLTATVTPGLTADTEAELQLTRDSATGAVVLYRDGTSVDTAATAAGDVAASTNELRIGSLLDGTLPFGGDIYWFEDRDGIDGPVVARADGNDPHTRGGIVIAGIPTTFSNGETWTDETGRTWTVTV